MSLLTRKGTLVRKHRTPLRKQSVRRTRSAGSTSSSGAAERPKVKGDDDPPYATSVPTSPTTRSHPRVPPSPLAKSWDGRCGSPLSSPPAHASPARSLTGTVVSFDDQRQLYKTSVDWSQQASVDVAPATQDLALQLEELAKDADSTCQFMARVGKVICSSDVVTVLLAVLLVVPVAMISLGVKYLDECPLEPRVPVYLLVGGCVLLLKLALALWRSLQRRRHDRHDVTYDAEGAGLSSRTYRFMNGVLTLFLLGWHVTGSCWLFAIWKPRYSPLLHDPSQWCEMRVYIFSVVQNIALYCLSCLYLALFCFLALLYRPPPADRLP